LNFCLSFLLLISFDGANVKAIILNGIEKCRFSAFLLANFHIMIFIIIKSLAFWREIDFCKAFLMFYKQNGMFSTNNTQQKKAFYLHFQSFCIVYASESIHIDTKDGT
jgi:hypothetical protein